MNEPWAMWSPARGVWETAVSNMLCGHLEPYSETWPTSGSMRNGQVYERPTSVPRMAGSGSSSSPGRASALLPTPQVADAMGGHATRSGARSGELLLPGVAASLA